MRFRGSRPKAKQSLASKTKTIVYCVNSVLKPKLSFQELRSSSRLIVTFASIFNKVTIAVSTNIDISELGYQQSSSDC